MSSASQASEWTKVHTIATLDDDFINLHGAADEKKEKSTERAYTNIRENWIKHRSAYILKGNVYRNPVSGERTPETKEHRTASKAQVKMTEIDAKIAASEARTDTKFAEMMGELRLINQRLDHVEKSTTGLRMNAWFAAATAVALVVAIFSWGSSMFGTGMDAQTIATQSAKNVIEQAQPQFETINARYERLEQHIGVILTAIEAQKKAEPTIHRPTNQ